MPVRCHRHVRRVAPAAVLLGVVTAVLPTTPALAATWTEVPMPATPVPTTAGYVGVDALSPSDVWAVGSTGGHVSQPWARPAVARFNGSTWSSVPTPALPDSAHLRGVDGSSATNVWAVGEQSGRPLAERWNGTAWSVVPAPSPAGTSGALEGVKVFSTTNAWAVGTSIGRGTPGIRTLIQRWDGAAWAVVPSPSPDPTQNLLADVDGAAPNDVWAIGNRGDWGYGTTVAGLVLHYDGTAWSTVDVPGIEFDATLSAPTLEDITVVASDDIWIVGRGFHRTLFRWVPVHWHFDGRGWQRGVMTDAPDGGFYGVTALPGNRVYAVGVVVARWDGAAWRTEPTPAQGMQAAAAAAAGTGTVWAVGSAWNPAVDQWRPVSVRTTNG
ncbi:MAG TPA: hypothetical protein VNV66_03850 [Pilimelia sp.]|nr:hypothetical protein [Pilimelia sp.]